MKTINQNTQTRFAQQQSFLRMVRLHAADMLEDNAVGEVRAYSSDQPARFMRDDELHMLLTLPDAELMEYLCAFEHIVFDGGNDDGYTWIATCNPQQLNIERNDHCELFTVIGFHDDTGRIWYCVISAANESAAFYWAAKAAHEDGYADVQIVAAIRGQHKPEQGMFFPGEGIVGQEILLELT